MIKINNIKEPDNKYNYKVKRKSKVGMIISILTIGAIASGCFGNSNNDNNNNSISKVYDICDVSNVSMADVNELNIILNDDDCSDMFFEDICQILRDDGVELIDILITCCNAINDMFLNLNHFKDIELINKKIIQVNRLEEQGDRIYEKLISSLYKDSKNPIEVIKWTKIYNCLEDTIDICEEVSDCIADTIMKNS